MFIACSKQLVARWRAELKKTGDSWQHDIYPDLIALFLDIIGQAALGTNFGALQGDAEDLVTSFGDGARRCLGETFALHEMIMVLAILLHQFTFRVESGDEAEMELGKFGPFISMLPKQSVHLTLDKRHIGDQTSVPTVPAQL
jgi:cytochrome P450